MGKQLELLVGKQPKITEFRAITNFEPLSRMGLIAIRAVLGNQSKKNKENVS